MEMKEKKMALIAPHFFGYEEHIAGQFTKEGFHVTYFDERKTDSKFNKVIIRLFPKLIQRQINHYYEEVLSQLVSQDIQFLVVVKAETMPIWFIQEYKRRFPKSVTIHYMQDSVKNYPHILEKANQFDYSLTFDRNDSELYNWIFRPFFFHDGYVPNGNEGEQYTFSFIGTIHGDRPIVMKKILGNFSEDIQHKSFIYYYVPLKLMFFYGKYIRKDYQTLKSKDISTTSINGKEVSRIVKASKCVIDIQHANQSGLTARTIETLGARRKLITTNKDVVNYDFYHPNNILVIDRQKPIIELNWLDREYVTIDPILYEYYSLKGFVNTMIDCYKNSIE